MELENCRRLELVEKQIASFGTKLELINQWQQILDPWLLSAFNINISALMAQAKDQVENDSNAKSKQLHFVDEENQSHHQHQSDGDEIQSGHHNSAKRRRYVLEDGCVPSQQYLLLSDSQEKYFSKNSCNSGKVSETAAGQSQGCSNSSEQPKVSDHGYRQKASKLSEPQLQTLEEAHQHEGILSNSQIKPENEKLDIEIDKFFSTITDTETATNLIEQNLCNPSEDTKPFSLTIQRIDMPENVLQLQYSAQLHSGKSVNPNKRKRKGPEDFTISPLSFPSFSKKSCQTDIKTVRRVSSVAGQGPLDSGNIIATRLNSGVCQSSVQGRCNGPEQRVLPSVPSYLRNFNSKDKTQGNTNHIQDSSGIISPGINVTRTGTGRGSISNKLPGKDQQLSNKANIISNTSVEQMKKYAEIGGNAIRQIRSESIRSSTSAECPEPCDSLNTCSLTWSLPTSGFIAHNSNKMFSKITENEAKFECMKFLSFLLAAFAKIELMRDKVKAHIQDLVDKQVNRVEFLKKLRRELNFQPEPSIIVIDDSLMSALNKLFQKGIFALRSALTSNELTLDGIRSPMIATRNQAHQNQMPSSFLLEGSDVPISLENLIPRNKSPFFSKKPQILDEYKRKLKVVEEPLQTLATLQTKTEFNLPSNAYCLNVIGEQIEMLTELNLDLKSRHVTANYLWQCVALSTDIDMLYLKNEFIKQAPNARSAGSIRKRELHKLRKKLNE